MTQQKLQCPLLVLTLTILSPTQKNAPLCLVAFRNCAACYGWTVALFLRTYIYFSASAVICHMCIASSPVKIHFPY